MALGTPATPLYSSVGEDGRGPDSILSILQRPTGVLSRLHTPGVRAGGTLGATVASLPPSGALHGVFAIAVTGGSRSAHNEEFTPSLLARSHAASTIAPAGGSALYAAGAAPTSASRAATSVDGVAALAREALTGGALRTLPTAARGRGAAARSDAPVPPAPRSRSAARREGDADEGGEYDWTSVGAAVPAVARRKAADAVLANVRAGRADISVQLGLPPSGPLASSLAGLPVHPSAAAAFAAGSAVTQPRSWSSVAAAASVRRYGTAQPRPALLLLGQTGPGISASRGPPRLDGTFAAGLLAGSAANGSGATNAQRNPRGQNPAHPASARTVDVDELRRADHRRQQERNHAEVAELASQLSSLQGLGSAASSTALAPASEVSNGARRVVGGSLAQPRAGAIIVPAQATLPVRETALEARATAAVQRAASAAAEAPAPTRQALARGVATVVLDRFVNQLVAGQVALEKRRIPLSVDERAAWDSVRCDVTRAAAPAVASAAHWSAPGWAFSRSLHW
jgi:hypothetical protein